MADKCLVSICIPTYNRAPYLKKCLDSLVCQAEFLNGDVEIVISDNASTDDTHNVVNEYQKTYGNITYHKNTMNISQINGNINYAIPMELGHGILRKLGGDTRIYREGSLKYFCSIAQKWKERKPVIYFNNGVFRDRIQRIEKITTMDRFLESASYMMTWIDTFLLWGEECDGLVAYARNHQSGFWFAEKTIELMNQKRFAVFFNSKLIEVKSVEKKNISYNIFKTFHDNYLGIMRDLAVKHIISFHTFKCLEKDLLVSFFPYFVVAWELHNSNFIYSDSENLKELVFGACQEKTYFREFQKSYLNAKIKMCIRTLPSLKYMLILIVSLLQRVTLK